MTTYAKGFGSFTGDFSDTDNEFFKSIFGDERTLHTYLLSNLSSHHNTSRFRLPNHIALYVTLLLLSEAGTGIIVTFWIM